MRRNNQYSSSLGLTSKFYKQKVQKQRFENMEVKDIINKLRKPFSELILDPGILFFGFPASSVGLLGGDSSSL